jgi:hypothetical protein
MPIVGLARLSAARRLRRALDDTDRAAARGARKAGVSYPMLAAAAGIARQVAWRRYGPAAGAGGRAGGGASPGRLGRS